MVGGISGWPGLAWIPARCTSHCKYTWKGASGEEGAGAAQLQPTAPKRGDPDHRF